MAANDEDPTDLDVPAEVPKQDTQSQGANKEMLRAQADQLRTAQEAALRMRAQEKADQEARDQAAQEQADLDRSAKEEAERDRPPAAIIPETDAAPKAPNASGYEGDTLADDSTRENPATETVTTTAPAPEVLGPPAPPAVAGDPKSQDAFQKIITNRDTIARGSTDKEAIKAIQQTLAKAGIAEVVEDEAKYKDIKVGPDGIRRTEDGKIALNKNDLGSFGKQTEAALDKFQEVVGINRDKKAGIVTAGALKAIDAAEKIDGNNMVATAKDGAIKAVIADGLTDREKKALGSLASDTSVTAATTPAAPPLAQVPQKREVVERQ